MHHPSSSWCISHGRTLNGLVGGLAICSGTSQQCKPWAVHRQSAGATPSAAAPSSSSVHTDEGPHKVAYAAEFTSPYYYWLGDTEEEELSTEEHSEQLDWSSTSSTHTQLATTATPLSPIKPPLHLPHAEAPASHTPAAPVSPRAASIPTDQHAPHTADSSRREDEEQSTPWLSSSDSNSSSASSLSSRAVALAWEASSTLAAPANNNNQQQRACELLQRCMHDLKHLTQDISTPGVAAACSLDQAAAITWACGSLFGVASRGEQQLKAIARRQQHDSEQQQRANSSADPLSLAHGLTQARLRLRDAVGVLLAEGPQPDQWAASSSSSGSKRSSGNGTVSSRALSTLLWGLAQMRLRPDASWLRGYMSHSVSLLLLRCYKPQELSTTLTALAHLRVQPPPQWCSHAMDVAAAPGFLSSASQQTLAALMWSMAVLRVRPSPAFMRQWYPAFSRSQQQQAPQTELSPQTSLLNAPSLSHTPQQQMQHLSMSLWALAKMDHTWHTHSREGDHTQCAYSKQEQQSVRPSQAWLASVLQQACAPGQEQQQQQQQEAHDSQHTENQQHQQQLQQPPPTSPPQQSLHTHPLLSHASPQSLANITWALGELHHTPAPPAAATLLHTATTKMRAMSPQGACSTLHGLAQSGVRPHTGWLSAVGVRLAVGVSSGQYSPAQLALLLRGMARLRGGASGTEGSAHRAETSKEGVREGTHTAVRNEESVREGPGAAFAAAALWAANRHMHAYVLSGRESLEPCEAEADSQQQQQQQQQQSKQVLFHQQQPHQQHQRQQTARASHPSHPLLTPATLAHMMGGLVDSGCSSYTLTPPSADADTQPHTPASSHSPSHSQGPQQHTSTTSLPSHSHSPSQDALSPTPNTLLPPRWRRACAAAVHTALSEGNGRAMSAPVLAVALPAACVLGLPHTRSRAVRSALHHALSNAHPSDTPHVAQLLLCAADPPSLLPTNEESDSTSCQHHHLANASWFARAGAFLAQHISHLPPHITTRLSAALPQLSAHPATHTAVCLMAAPLAVAAASKMHAMPREQVVQCVHGLAAMHDLFPSQAAQLSSLSQRHTSRSQLLHQQQHQMLFASQPVRRERESGGSKSSNSDSTEHTSDHSGGLASLPHGSLVRRPLPFDSTTSQRGSEHSSDSSSRSSVHVNADVDQSSKGSSNNIVSSSLVHSSSSSSSSNNSSSRVSDTPPLRSHFLIPPTAVSASLSTPTLSCLPPSIPLSSSRITHSSTAHHTITTPPLHTFLSHLQPRLPSLPLRCLIDLGVALSTAPSPASPISAHRTGNTGAAVPASWSAAFEAATAAQLGKGPRASDPLPAADIVGLLSSTRKVLTASTPASAGQVAPQPAVQAAHTTTRSAGPSPLHTPAPAPAQATQPPSAATPSPGHAWMASWLSASVHRLRKLSLSALTDTLQQVGQVGLLSGSHSTHTSLLAAATTAQLACSQAATDTSSSECPSEDTGASGEGVAAQTQEWMAAAVSAVDGHADVVRARFQSCYQRQLGLQQQQHQQQQQQQEEGVKKSSAVSESSSSNNTAVNHRQSSASAAVGTAESNGAAIGRSLGELLCVAGQLHALGRPASRSLQAALAQGLGLLLSPLPSTSAQQSKQAPSSQLKVSSSSSRATSPSSSKPMVWQGARTAQHSSSSSSSSSTVRRRATVRVRRSRADESSMGSKSSTSLSRVSSSRSSSLSNSISGSISSSSSSSSSSVDTVLERGTADVSSWRASALVVCLQSVQSLSPSLHGPMVQGSVRGLLLCLTTCVDPHTLASQVWDSTAVPHTAAAATVNGSKATAAATANGGVHSAPHGLAVDVLQLCARWDVEPPQAWVVGLLEVCSFNTASATGPQLSSLLRGCALLCKAPLPSAAQPALARILSALLPRLSQCSASGAVEIAWALSCLLPAGNSITTTTNTDSSSSSSSSNDLSTDNSTNNSTNNSSSSSSSSSTNFSSSHSGLETDEVSAALLDGQACFSTEWWAAYEEHMTGRLIAGDLTPPALAELLWSVGALGRRPSLPWMEAFAAAAAAALPRFCPDDMARLVWALAAVREEAPAGVWMDRFFAVSSVRLSSSAFSAHHLALMAGGLAVLRARPRADWLARFADQVLVHLHEARGVHLAKILSSLATLAYTPSDTFMSTFMATASAALPHDLTPHCAAELAWAVACCDSSHSRVHARAFARQLAAAGLHAAATLAAPLPSAVSGTHSLGLPANGHKRARGSKGARRSGRRKVMGKHGPLCKLYGRPVLRGSSSVSGRRRSLYSSKGEAGARESTD